MMHSAAFGTAVKKKPGCCRVTCRPQGYELQQCQEEQEAWGASSEKATRAFMENLAVRGGQAAQNAGQPKSMMHV